MLRYIWKNMVLLITCCLLCACSTPVTTIGQQGAPSPVTPVVTASPSPRLPENPRIRIMPLGDSITYGVDGSRHPTYLGVDNGGGYRFPLWNKLIAEGERFDFVGSQKSGPGGFDQENEGHYGWCIDQIAAQVAGWLNTYQPQIILLHIGTNDMLQKAEPTCAPNDPLPPLGRLEHLVDLITTTAPNATLIVAQIIPINASANAQVIAYNAAIPALVQARASQGKHVQYIDMYDSLSTRYLPDHIHPNADGYALMANVWNQALLPLLHINSCEKAQSWLGALLSSPRS